MKKTISLILSLLMVLLIVNVAPGVSFAEVGAAKPSQVDPEAPTPAPAAQADQPDSHEQEQKDTVPCPDCAGEGRVSSSCTACNGRGRTGSSNSTCSQCGGTGKVYSAQQRALLSTDAALGSGNIDVGKPKDLCMNCFGTGKASDKCGSCNGTGKIYRTCSTCQGSGVVKSDSVKANKTSASTQNTPIDIEVIAIDLAGFPIGSSLDTFKNLIDNMRLPIIDTKEESNTLPPWGEDGTSFEERSFSYYLSGENEKYHLKYKGSEFDVELSDAIEIQLQVEKDDTVSSILITGFNKEPYAIEEIRNILFGLSEKLNVEQSGAVKNLPVFQMPPLHD